MTILVALKDKDCVHLATDTLSSADYAVSNDNKQKIMEFKDFCIATTGYAAYTIFLEEYFKKPENSQLELSDKMQVFGAFKGFYRYLKSELSYGTANNNEIPCLYNNFILVTKDKMFKIFSNFSIDEYSEVGQYIAEGCGSSFALGSLHTSASWDNYEDRVKIAVESANKFSLGCSGYSYKKLS